ncbi:MAG: 3-phosphoshikimate 1-carboxyvinyltransferase [Chloroflexota bacterium]
MRLKVMPSAVSGHLAAPPSKSYTHRALILGALARGETVITNYLDADDTRYTADALRTLGTNILTEGNTVKIEGRDGKFSVQPGRETIFVGNSGSTVRMVAPLSALTQGRVVFEGEPRLYQRPVSDLLVALKALGIRANSINRDGFPPIEIYGGTLLGGEVVVSGMITSQHVSGLLMVAPYARRNVRLKISGELLSKPYVDVTIEAMRHFGGEVGNLNYEHFVVTAGERYRGCEYKIEGDYSSAAYFFAMGAIGGTAVSVTGLNPRSVQGDRHFLDLIARMGCDVSYGKDGLTVSRQKPLVGITQDMGDYPDIVQPLAMTAAFAGGKTLIKNIGHLIYKETDRINHTAMELRKMGVAVAVTENTMLITGGKPKGAEFESHNDHRLVMSLATAALFASGETVINGAEAASKSYPDFFRDLAKIGARFQEI